MNKVTQEIRDAIASNNIENIRAKIQDLKNILAEISTQAYQSAGASSAQAGTAGPEFTGGGPTGSGWPTEPTGSAGWAKPLAITIFERYLPTIIERMKICID